MTWLKIDDGFCENPKIVGLSNQAFRLHLAGLCLCARNLTDGLVSERGVRGLAATIGISPKRYTQELVAARLWTESKGGWRIKDFLEYNPSADAVKAQRASNTRRQALFRDPALREAIRGRDGDYCRYCGTEVHWADRRGPDGATYDHVNPSGPNSMDNLVIACRACNARKGGKTPEDAGMVLIPIQNITKSDLVSSTTPTRPVLNSEKDLTDQAQVIDLVKRVQESFGSAS